MPTNLPPAHILKAATRLWSQAGQAHWVAVQGQSMHPFLHAGDEVMVTPGPAELRRGDVVVLKIPTGLMVHRLLRAEPWLQPQRLLTQGDNNRRPDPPSGADDLLGPVRAVRRPRGTLALDTPRWRVSGWLIASALAAVNGLDAWSGSWRVLGRLAAGAGWRLVRLFCLIACR